MVSLEEKTAGKRSKQGRWTDEEQRLFASAVQIHGKRWKKLEQVMGTRTSTQCRSHGQKYFLKLKKDQARTITTDSTREEGTESSGDFESAEMPAEIGENEGNLEDMDNNQLKECLERLVLVNGQLMREIQRLRLRHCDHGETSTPQNSLEKRQCGVIPVQIPSKTREVKVIFHDPEFLS